MFWVEQYQLVMYLESEFDEFVFGMVRMSKKLNQEVEEFAQHLLRIIEV